jgi:hypothetical protein
MYCFPSPLCRVRHSAKPVPSVFQALPSVLQALGKEVDSGSACMHHESFNSVSCMLTTRNNCFVECLKHSTKPRKYSAKALLSVTLGKEGSTIYTSAIASLSSTFYAECHSVLDKEKSLSWRQVTATESVPSAHRVTLGKGSLFAECPLH